MKKRLQISLYSILITFLFTVSVLGQQYTFKQTIGKTNVYYPADISVDKQGNTYVSSRNGSIVKMDPDGYFLSTIIAADKTIGGVSLTNSDWVKYTTLDLEGNLWVIDSYHSKITKLDSHGNVLLQFGSSGTGDTQFNKPTDITIDRQGNIWIADQANNRIQKFDANGKFLLKLYIYPNENGLYIGPRSITIDSQDNIWLIDRFNVCIHKLDKNGKFLFSAGSYNSC